MLKRDELPKDEEPKCQDSVKPSQEEISPQPLIGEIIEGSSKKDSSRDSPFILHNLDGNIRSFQLRWQIGCLGCLIPLIIVFMIFFFSFRLGTNLFG